MKSYQSTAHRVLFFFSGILLIIFTAFFWEKMPLVLRIVFPTFGIFSISATSWSLISRKPLLELDNTGLIYRPHSKKKISWLNVKTLHRGSFVTTGNGDPVATDTFKRLDTISVSYKRFRDSILPSDHPSTTSWIDHCDINFSILDCSPDDFLSAATHYMKSAKEAQQGAAANPYPLRS